MLCVKVRRNVGNWRQCAAGNKLLPPWSFPLNAKCASGAPGTQMSWWGGGIPLKDCKNKRKKTGTSRKRFWFFSCIHLDEGAFLKNNYWQHFTSLHLEVSGSWDIICVVAALLLPHQPAGLFRRDVRWFVHWKEQTLFAAGKLFLRDLCKMDDGGFLLCLKSSPSSATERRLN